MHKKKKLLSAGNTWKMLGRKSLQSGHSGMDHHNSFLFTTIKRDKGFSLLEVLIGVSLFMVGLLGITALQISSLKSTSFAGNLSEATMLAASRIDEIMAWDFDDSRLTDKQAAGADGYGEWSDDSTWYNQLDVLADDNETNMGRNGMYTIYMNISEEDPLPNCKQIDVIVHWDIKDVPRRISMPFTLMKKI